MYLSDPDRNKHGGPRFPIAVVPNNFLKIMIFECTVLVEASGTYCKLPD